MNNYLKWIGILIGVLLVGGCQILGVRIATGAGAMPAYEPLPERDYDAKPQIIYAIDNHRFFASENYEKMQCRTCLLQRHRQKNKHTCWVGTRYISRNASS